MKKKEIPEKFIKVLKGETTIVPESRATLNIIDKIYFFKDSQLSCIMVCGSGVQRE